MKHLLRLFGLSAMLLWVSAVPASAMTDAQGLNQWLQQPRLQFGDAEIETRTLSEFYTSRNFQPVWVDTHGLSAASVQMLDLFAAAGNHGLNPTRYHTQTIRAVASMPAHDETTMLQVRLSLELLMSDAVMRYGADMRGGAVRPQWDAGKGRISPDDLRRLLTQAAGATNPATVLAALAPKSPQYAGLQASLQHYQSLAAHGGWPNFSVGKPIKPGANDPRIASLREILTITGDMPAAMASTNPTLYDTAIEHAVRQFQARHGVTADGVIGTGTQEALAVSAPERVAQLAITLERMRWMPDNLGPRYVLVNIPSYTLTAVSGSNQMAMNVIVGKRDTKTPMFSKEITNVVLNPSWGVPQKIAIKEMLPKVRKNPQYLSNAGYTVTETRGGVSYQVNPQDIDWNSVGQGNFAYNFRQNPGDGNALGKVKFTIPDSDNIYLHDTSQRGLFVKSERSLSHGCVRLADPKALAEFVLRDEGWSEAKIDAAYDSDASRTVPIAPLPVHLVYWTSWVDGAGNTHFSRDVYGMDKPLLTAMGEPKNRVETVKLAMN
ncbi:MAG: murein L,D-transpeptidase [Rickettsiales bacterium]